MLANVFESMLGGLYRFRGIEVCIRLVAILCEQHLTRLSTFVPAKQILHEWTQKKYHQTPVYRNVSVQGPKHSQIFVQEVVVNGQSVAQGAGATKKEASQKAAAAALLKLNISTAKA